MNKIFYNEEPRSKLRGMRSLSDSKLKVLAKQLRNSDKTNESRSNYD